MIRALLLVAAALAAPALAQQPAPDTGTSPAPATEPDTAPAADPSPGPARDPAAGTTITAPPFVSDARPPEPDTEAEDTADPAPTTEDPETATPAAPTEDPSPDADTPPATARDPATAPTTAEPSPAPEAATGPEPVLRLEIDPESVVPGQPVTARLTVLVPTFLPDPPDFPSFEIPNVITRLPEGASGPVSERIDGETWSGISRAYRLAPMIPGRVEVPPQPVTVTYADPDSREPVQVTLQTPAFAFAAVVPEGATGLDPFIAATDLTLAQEIEGDPAALAPGDALTRRVTATVTGLSPLFVPPLIPDIAPDAAGTALPAYPDAPQVTETDDRGVTSGTRTESVTYVPAGGGSHTAPEISLDWFNLETGEVETATVPGFDITTSGPPPRAAGSEAASFRTLLPWLAALLAAAALLLWLLRRYGPALGRRRAARHAARLASEPHAFALVRAAAAARDAAGLGTALTVWSARLAPGPATDPAEAALAGVLADLGRARYGPDPAAPSPAEAWAALPSALDAARAARNARSADPAATGGLPALNPT